MTVPLLTGVWGGKSVRERRRIRSEWLATGRTTATTATPDADSCGTERGYRRHRRHGEDPCARCKEAHAAERGLRVVGA